jgi:hypothetical protein
LIPIYKSKIIQQYKMENIWMVMKWWACSLERVQSYEVQFLINFLLTHR